MTRPSALSGWRFTRRARRVLLGAWIGEVLAAAPLTWALASLGKPTLSAAADSSGLTSRQVLEAVGQTALRLDTAAGPLVAAFAVTLATAALWKVFWLGGLAASWSAPGEPSLRGALCAALPISLRLVRHAAYALVLTGVLAGVALALGVGVKAMATRGPWWVEGAALGVRALLFVLAVALGFSVASRSRWLVACGGTPVRALAIAARAAIGRPFGEALPSLLWLILSRSLAAMWLASRLAGEVLSLPGAAIATGLLLVTALAGAWLRGALLLAWAPQEDGELSRRAQVPPSSPASARAA